MNAYRALLNQTKDKVGHKEHCFRNAKSADIQGAMVLTESEVEDRGEIGLCQSKEKAAQEGSASSTEAADENRPHESIKRQKQGSSQGNSAEDNPRRLKEMWFHIGRAMKGPRSGKMMTVQK